MENVGLIDFNISTTNKTFEMSYNVGVLYNPERF